MYDALPHPQHVTHDSRSPVLQTPPPRERGIREARIRLWQPLPLTGNGPTARSQQRAARRALRAAPRAYAPSNMSEIGEMCLRGGGGGCAAAARPPLARVDAMSCAS